MPVIDIEKRLHATAAGTWVNQGGYFCASVKKGQKPIILYDKKSITAKMLMALAKDIERHAKNDRMSGQQLAIHNRREVERDEDEV